MTRDVLDRVAFAIQDESMTRLQARRYARAALEALFVGDHFNSVVIRSAEEAEDGRGLFVLDTAVPNRVADL